jgi:hypothetical protein
MHPTTPQEIAEMRYYVDVAYEMLMSRRRAGASADEIERRKGRSGGGGLSMSKLPVNCGSSSANDDLCGRLISA